MAIVLISVLTILYVEELGTNFDEIPYDEIITDQRFYETSIKKGWHKINLNHFTIEVPNKYRFVKHKGMDSFVGSITNGLDSIRFDFGWYSNELNSFVDSTNYIQQNQIINNRKFKIVRSIINTGFVGAFTEDLPDQNRLAIWCHDCQEIDEKVAMYQTIKFRN